MCSYLDLLSLVKEGQRKACIKLANNIKKYQIEQKKNKKEMSNISDVRVHMGSYSKNDYRNYVWLSFKCKPNDEVCWLTMFYNDVDTKSGNYHTQIGRIQFVKGIKNHNGRYGPHFYDAKDSKRILKLCAEENCAEPKKSNLSGYEPINGAFYTIDDILRSDLITEYIINEFLKFISTNSK